ncbi:hypothetical protein OG21DRAFT_1503982 [Imleria badia]|nr:hypothetical protein OG21DRAFT_1503982 [Imleria badia]
MGTLELYRSPCCFEQLTIIGRGCTAAANEHIKLGLSSPFTQKSAMDDLKPGKYDIFSVVAPGPLIGADDNNQDLKPVITEPEGDRQTWFVTKVDEFYRIFLEDTWFASKENDKVVVKFKGIPMAPDPWKITRVGENAYLIKSTDANKAWTVETRGSEVAPKSQVSLKFLTGPVNEDQIFKFVPVL